MFKVCKIYYYHISIMNILNSPFFGVSQMATYVGIRIDLRGELKYFIFLYECAKQVMWCSLSASPILAPRVHQIAGILTKRQLE
jgi:hypothetical protein